MEMQMTNPYGVAPASPMANDDARHDSGNALAANAEARAVAEVKAQIWLAREYPRNPALAVDEILRECQRPTLAESAIYAFPRGKETVSGPSIRLAEVLARNWQHVNFGYDVPERNYAKGGGPGYSVIRAYAWDMQTNTYVARQFELKHWRSTRSGGYPITDDRDIYELEANMAARRIRACILQVIPGDVTQAAVDACRATSNSALATAMKDPQSRRTMFTKILKIFEKIGVTQEDLEGYLNARYADWTADHALRIKELKNSLDDGVTSLGDAFPRLASGARNDVVTKAQSEELMKLAKETGRQGDISAALKLRGIAKIADTPAARFAEIKALIETFLPGANGGEPHAEPNP